MTDQTTLSNDQRVRGKTPENIEERCLSLCQSYIGGAWSKAATCDITVTRITGGLTNQLFRVQLNHPEGHSDEPTDVAVKLYMKKHVNTSGADGDDERLNDNIVLTIMSQKDLGPRVYGIFAGGNIQAFHKHELFGPLYHQNKEIIQKVCHQLAQINHLSVPIRKADFVMKQIVDFLELGYSNPKIVSLIQEIDVPILKSRDLREELAALNEIIAKQAAPTVFCHNDFLGCNIMIVGPEKRVLVIDLEYCSYGPRGVDFAMLLNQYGQEAFDWENLELPADGVLEQYLQYYIDACDEIVPGYSQKPGNSLEAHVKEVKVATLRYMMVLMSFFIKQEESIFDDGEPVNLENNLKYVNELYRRYNETKKRMIEDGTIAA